MGIAQRNWRGGYRLSWSGWRWGVGVHSRLFDGDLIVCVSLRPQRDFAHWVVWIPKDGDKQMRTWTGKRFGGRA